MRPSTGRSPLTLPASGGPRPRPSRSSWTNHRPASSHSVGDPEAGAGGQFADLIRVRRGPRRSGSRRHRVLHMGVEPARRHPRRVQLDQSGTARREEPWTRVRSSDRVAADSDVAVQQQRGRPVAGAGNVGRTPTPGPRAPPGGGPSAPRRRTRLCRGRRGRPRSRAATWRPGPQPTSRTGLSGPGQHAAAPPAGPVRATAPPAAPRPRRPRSGGRCAAGGVEPARRGRVGRMAEQFVGPRAQIGHRARQHAMASAAVTARGEAGPGDQGGARRWRRRSCRRPEVPGGAAPGGRTPRGGSAGRARAGRCSWGRR